MKMSGFNPPTFTVTGGGFTPNGYVSIDVMDVVNNVGTSVVLSEIRADSNGNINDTINTELLTTLFPNTPGTYYGSIEALDVTTGKISNAVNIIYIVT